MNRLVSKLAARRARLADDKGASLVLALIFITVVAVVMGVVLSYAETNLRTTVAMRGQAASSAAADGAAKVAVNELRRGPFDGSGDCFGTSGATRTLSNFYTSAGQTGSAAVSCALDTTNSATSPITTQNSPPNALIALGKSTDVDQSDQPGEAVYAKINGGDNTVNVEGGVFSQSKINIFHGELHANGTVKARGTCSGTITTTATKQCSYTTADTTGDDPGYTVPPPTSTVDRSDLPPCSSSQSAEVPFSPGIYTNLHKLNAAMNCPGLVYHFNPGTYYFDFNGTWTIGDGYVIGGTTPPGVSYNTAHPPSDSAIETACQSPVPLDGNLASWTPPAPNLGVTFVFGSEAQVYFTDTAKVALCGNYSTTAPPIVIYGLKANYTVGSTTIKAPVPNSCIMKRSCAIISTYKNAEDYEVYLNGTTYTPNAWVDLDLKKELQFFIRGGLIVHNVTIDGPGNTGTPTPMVGIPNRSTAPFRTIVWLNVYLCPGSATCAATGTPKLRVKVNITRSSAGVREATVLNWSVVR